ncbi:MAG: MFS transporter [Myxococcales bacterium]|jgi:MFS family permease
MKGLSKPLRFVVLLGAVSLLADVTYEGARSVTGPYLALLGASGAAVGIVAGAGELFGYALRLWSGRLADRTQRYWALTLIGYAINLFAVPALALANHWPAAAALIIVERTGKAIRTPARDAMLSYATHEAGRGWGFGLHEAMDQIGATLGPMVVAGVLWWRGDYRTGFAVLLLPALAALTVLLVARRLYPKPHELEPAGRDLSARGFPRAFWLYLAATCLVGVGFADYPLLAYHFQVHGTVPATWIPIFYSIAMAVDAVCALGFGRWFDRRGISVLAVSTAISALFAPFAFGSTFGAALAGAVLWGVGLGAQESVMRAAIATMAPPSLRGTAYGLFNMVFGVFWFLGSSLLGWLYDHSVLALVITSMTSQAMAIPLFLIAERRRIQEK